VRGEGVTVDLDGHPLLRDLVDKTTFRWSKLAALTLREIDTYGKIIKNLEKTHWYLASAYEKEKKFLKLCKTRHWRVSHVLKTWMRFTR
jgi:uncharacterized protein YifE (UPF0438 family)